MAPTPARSQLQKHKEEITSLKAELEKVKEEKELLLVDQRGWEFKEDALKLAETEKLREKLEMEVKKLSENLEESRKQKKEIEEELNETKKLLDDTKNLEEKNAKLEKEKEKLSESITKKNGQLYGIQAKKSNETIKDLTQKLSHEREKPCSTCLAAATINQDNRAYPETRPYNSNYYRGGGGGRSRGRHFYRPYHY